MTDNPDGTTRTVGRRLADGSLVINPYRWGAWAALAVTVIALATSLSGYITGLLHGSVRRQR